MAILSTLGRTGGIASSRERKGDSAWGRAFVQHRNQKRGGRAQKRHYPELSRIWIENARRTRLGLPLIPVQPVDTPAANRMRALRQLRKRREGYERARSEGVPQSLPHRSKSFLEA